MVSKGQKLATVTKASVLSTLLEINETIDELEDAMDTLESKSSFSDTSSDTYLQYLVYKEELSTLKSMQSRVKKIRKKGAIYATSDGMIDSINITSDSDSSSETSSETSGFTNTSSIKEASIISLSTSTSSSGQTEQEELTTITDEMINKIQISAPVTGQTPQDAISSTDAYSATISWDCSGSFKAQTVYTATITLTAKEGYTFALANSYAPTIQGASISSDSPILIGTANTAGNKLRIKAIFSKTEANNSNEKEEQETSNQKTTKDTSTKDTSSSDQSHDTTASSSSSPSSSASVQSSLSTSSSANSTSSSSSSSSSSTKDSYSISTTSAFTIASSSQVLVCVDIDELDISSVEEGQSATITLDALEDQEFTGTITSVSHTASSSNGGNAKYTCRITTKKADGMLVGMTASATITVNEVTDVLTIPVSALQEDANGSYVYTEKDSDGNLSGKTEVTTGLSNGNDVEIQSGLSKGDTVYYTQASTSNSEESNMGGFGGSDKANDASMPDMNTAAPSGQMPSGGGKGGGPSGN